MKLYSLISWSEGFQGKFSSEVISSENLRLIDYNYITWLEIIISVFVTESARSER